MSDPLEAEVAHLLHKLRQPLASHRALKHPYTGQWYLKSADVIREANEVFGPLGWSEETLSCEMVSAIPNQGKSGDLWAITCSAIVKLTIHPAGQPLRPLVVKSGVGACDGMKRSYAEAYGDAFKGAKSDALKRAFMKLGYRFGLALYFDPKKDKAIFDRIRPELFGEPDDRHHL